MPGVIRDIGSSERVALAASYRIRRQEPFHALEISGRCAVSLVQVTATDPFRGWRHPDLVTQAVVAYRRPDRMSAKAVVIARERRIVAARIADAVMNGVVPVVVVIGSDSVPAAVMRL